MTTGIFFWVEPAVCGGVMISIFKVQNRSAFNFIIELESRIVILYVFFLIITFPLFSNLFFFLVGILLFYLTNSNLPKATGTESRANLLKEDESEKCKRQLSGHKTSDTLILANPDSNV